MLGALIPALAGCDPVGSDTSGAFQANPGHTGVATTSISRTAKVLWSRDFSEPDTGFVGVGTPVIHGDLIVVPVAFEAPPCCGAPPDTDPTNDSRVIAFDRLTGTVRWTRTLGDPGTLTLAAADGRIFASGGKQISALRESDGTVLWSATTSGGSEAGPTAVGGDVLLSTVEHVEGNDPRLPRDYDTIDGTLIDYDAVTGAVRWQHVLPYVKGLTSSPAVDRDQVVVGSADGGTAAVSRSDGTLRWSRAGATGRPDGGDAVATPFLVYVGETAQGAKKGTILDRATGAMLRTFESSFAPIVDGDHLYIDAGDRWTARSADGRMLQWQGTVDTGITQQPLLAGGTLFATAGGPGSGRILEGTASLVGWSRSDGAEVFRLPMGAWRNEFPNMLHRGMAAGSNVLAIPYGTRLVVVG
jgi:outer membrane protein assembly factor BamB